MHLGTHKNNKKVNKVLIRICTGLMAAMLTCSFAGCKKKSEEKFAMKIGDETLTPGMLRYYAYNAQASYETYYLASGNHIHWNEGMNGETIESKVKDQTLEDVINRYKLISHADDFEVDKKDIRKKDVDDMVKNYKDNTAEVLKKKVDATDKELEDIFTTYIMYDEICEYIKEKYDLSVDKEIYRQVSINLIEVKGEKSEDIATKICAEVNKGGKIVDVAAKYKQEVIEGSIGAGDRDRDKIELACLAMKTGECVSVKTDLKNYVIYCVNDNDEKATEIIAKDKEEERLKDQIKILIKNYKDSVKIDEKLWGEINFNEPIFEEK